MMMPIIINDYNNGKHDATMPKVNIMMTRLMMTLIVMMTSMMLMRV